jgi:predicted nucleotidyltransferase
MVNREYAINTSKAFVTDCMNYGLQFDKVLLFGSSITNHVHEGSDIDLLLISKQFTNNPFENLKLYSKINIKYPLIETHCYNTQSYIEGNEFINEIAQNSIEVII